MAERRALPHLNEILNIKKAKSPKRIQWEEYSLKDTIFFSIMFVIAVSFGLEAIQMKFLPGYVFFGMIIVLLNVARKYKRNASRNEIKELCWQTAKIVMVEVVIWIAP